MEQVSERSDIDAVIDLGQENSHGLDPFLGCAVRYDALPIKVGLGPHGKLSGKLLVVGDFAQNAIPNWPSGGACAKGGEFLAIEHILLRQACAEICQPKCQSALNFDPLSASNVDPLELSRPGAA
jgi:hypothetical protein